LGLYLNPSDVSVVNPTSGGSSANVREEYFSLLPCDLLQKLVDKYQLDMEMFDYDAKDFLRLCK